MASKSVRRIYYGFPSSSCPFWHTVRSFFTVTSEVPFRHLLCEANQGFCKHVVVLQLTTAYILNHAFPAVDTGIGRQEISKYWYSNLMQFRNKAAQFTQSLWQHTRDTKPIKPIWLL